MKWTIDIKRGNELVVSLPFAGSIEMCKAFALQQAVKYCGAFTPHKYGWHYHVLKRNHRICAQRRKKGQELIMIFVKEVTDAQ